MRRADQSVWKERRVRQFRARIQVSLPEGVRRSADAGRGLRTGDDISVVCHEEICQGSRPTFLPDATRLLFYCRYGQ